jgi:hypothetical protein
MRHPDWARFSSNARRRQTLFATLTLLDAAKFTRPAKGRNKKEA